jgi:chromosome segregation ATPase
MAQMRVKDQDLIVQEVVSTIEDNKLQEFKARKDVQSLHSKIQARLDAITQLKNQLDELEKTIKTDKEEVRALVMKFQEKNNLATERYGENQGFHMEYNSYSTNVPTCRIVWQLSYIVKQKLTTKLRLETMGGDFNAYELIEQLVNEFSN